MFEPLEMVVSMLSPRLTWRRMVFGTFEMLGRGFSSAGVVGDKVGATVVAGVPYAVSAEPMLENVETDEAEVLPRVWPIS